MDQSQGSDIEVVSGTRKFLSPNRILARSFRRSRDSWRDKHHLVQAKLEQERQLSAERGRSRDQWQAKCDIALGKVRETELLAQQRLTELEQARIRIAQLEAEFASKQKWRATAGMKTRSPHAAQRPSA